MYREATRENKIYVGLNDSITKQQLFETDKYKSVLKNVCYSYHVSFSVSMIEGGYFSEDGGFVQEDSIVITLIDVDEKTVEEIARDLCAFFHQESVLVTEGTIRAFYIQERID
ncbi:MAG: hypothetical protein IIY51_04810 [Erysipelotrichaceae bacterium]|nr:hypothetical protein [Erysipelotrichaceae bacterium]MBQ1304199.1 hypothetical protein [Erysipelotrichaceae bacterium]